MEWQAQGSSWTVLGVSHTHLSESWTGARVGKTTGGYAHAKQSQEGLHAHAQVREEKAGQRKRTVSLPTSFERERETHWPCPSYFPLYMVDNNGALFSSIYGRK